MTAWTVLATCGPAALLGLWMLCNAHRSIAAQARADTAFWAIARHYTVTAEEPQP
jgi:hypothetical protein